MLVDVIADLGLRRVLHNIGIIFRLARDRRRAGCAPWW